MVRNPAVQREPAVMQMPKPWAEEQRDTAKGVSTVVPAYNEEHAVSPELEQLLQVMNDNGQPSEVIVVDDGSQGATAEVAERYESMTVLWHRGNRGYGALLKTGIRHVQYELICMTDADGTYPNERIPDLNSRLRVFRREVALRLFNMLPDGFSFTTTITLAMLTNGYLVDCVPINYHARIGRSKIRPVQDTLNFMQLNLLLLSISLVGVCIDLDEPYFLSREVLYSIGTGAPKISALVNPFFIDRFAGVTC